jgi:hypothetical protein
VSSFRGSLQGKLFERLVKDIVNACGYKDIELRAKRASMEYDITATAKLSSERLVGEAKAHTKKIDGTTISSFVGKMHPIWVSNPRTLGLFISTSDFTPEAKDYLGSIHDQGTNRRTIIGQQIIDLLSKELKYLSVEQVKSMAARDFNARPGENLLLVSDRGDFFIQLLIRADETRPRAFCVYHNQGSIINETAFGKELKGRIPILEELLFWPSELKGKSFLDLERGRMAPLQGTGWFDYRFPAPPDCFVGRSDERNAFLSFVRQSRTKKSKVSVFQVLSRSGVGKSSFLLKLQDDLSRDKVISIIADARNFRSILDFLELTQEFIQTLNTVYKTTIPIPYDLDSGLLALQETSEQLRRKDNLGFFLIDQFESLFAKPALYTEFIDFILETTLLCGNILFCVARKNDQPTTYDDRAKIDLERLREVSETITLEDFRRDEAVTLISHIEDEIEQPLLDRLKEMALEFSQGFPWLQKRICAHIISMIKKGSKQEELVQWGLKSEELFREELADLDEIEKDFLRRLALYLPATLSELHEVFGDGDVMSKRIDSLQAHRLIRLTGRTYDTYNDVLKEYLRTGRIPFGIKYVFRTSPIATLNLIHRIYTHNWQTIAEIREKERKSKGGIFNRLRELRLLGLLDYSRGNIRLAETTFDAYRNETIGRLLQERVRQNGLVKDILGRLTITERIKFNELKELMKASMPLLDVSEDTWDAYSNNLSRWLDRTKLAAMSGKDMVLRREGETISQDEITRIGRQKGVLPFDFFLPLVYVNGLIAVLEEIKKSSVLGEELRNAANLQHRQNALTDCLAVGLVGRASGQKLTLTGRGKQSLANSAEAKEILKEFLLSKPNVVSYLDRVGNNPTSHLVVLKETLAGINPGWTKGTWEWRSKVLTNWLVYAELLKRRKGKVVSYPARLF